MTPLEPKNVVIKAKALKKIILYAKRYANDAIPRNSWKEVYGFLIGRNAGNVVFVDDAVAMVAGDVTEVHFTEQHYANTYKLNDEISAKNDGTFLCGWWHTHPFPDDKDSLFLSDVDIKNHLFFQSVNPLAIALVHDPSKISSADIPLGTKVFRLRRTDFTDDDFIAMGNNADLFSGKNNDYYHEIPFSIPAITAQFFTRSLLELYEKVLAGEPPELAYEEEWRKVESSLDAESGTPDEAGTETMGSDSSVETATGNQVEKTEVKGTAIETGLAYLGLIGWILPLVVVAIQFSLAAAMVNSGYNIVGGIFTLIITILYTMRTVMPACKRKDWKFLADDVFDIGQYKVSKILIVGILLEFTGIGMAGLLLITMWFIIKSYWPGIHKT